MIFRDRRLKHLVPNTGWNQRRQRGPIRRAVYTVSTTSNLLIFLRNISCPCVILETRVTPPLPPPRLRPRRSHRHPINPCRRSNQLWLTQPAAMASRAVIMASVACYEQGRGNGSYRIINWPGNFLNGCGVDVFCSTKLRHDV